MQDFIVEKDGKNFVDIVKILPEEFGNGKRIVCRNLSNNKVEIYIKKAPGKAGHDSKKFILNRLIELDELFFEGLGLWQAEGGKTKGIYFGNSCTELLLYFLKFVEQKLGLTRKMFRVTVNSPDLNKLEGEINKWWSEKLKIPLESFTHVCYDTRINQEYAQVYINGIAVLEVMKNLHEKLKNIVLLTTNFTISYLKGIIAGEGQVALRKSGTISHVSIASSNLKDVVFYKKCLAALDIKSGKYMENGRKFPIYGRKNLEKVKSLGLINLHSEKRLKFENGLRNYKRNVMKGEEMEILILKQLLTSPKTYDDISSSLRKGRSTIQSYYIPILERKGLIKRIGKKRAAWLFSLTKDGIKFLKVKRAPP